MILTEYEKTALAKNPCIWQRDGFVAGLRYNIEQVQKLEAKITVLKQAKITVLKQAAIDYALLW